MDTYGDPGFHYHATVSKLLGLYTARLAESPVVPLNATDYATALEGYISNVENKLNSIIDGTPFEEDEIEIRAAPTPVEIKGDINSLKLSFQNLHDAASKLIKSATEHDAWAAELAEEAGEDIPWWKWYSKLKLFYSIRRVNTKYKFLERQFLYHKGLDGRSWFKHVIFAPGIWTGYSGAVFPGLVEAIQAKDYENAERWVGIIERGLVKAAKSLE
jgi:N-acetylated-alpha-linked acidic dipeptidase